MSGYPVPTTEKPADPVDENGRNVLERCTFANPGNNTTDQVFLLSIAEVNKYFSSGAARQCKGTAYCNAQGADNAVNVNCWWWLRSPGGSASSAANVGKDGSVNEFGSSVKYDNTAVRPALWIDLE